MSFLRVLRIIFGIFLAAVFICYSYLHNVNWIKSSDVTGLSNVVVSVPQAAPTAEPEQAPVIAPVEKLDASLTVGAAQEEAPAPEPTVDPDSPYGRALANAAALGLPAPPDVDINAWEFVLVNGDNSIAEYVPESTVSVESQIVDSRIVDALNGFVGDARNQGLNVYLSSGYRSYSEQAANFQRVCQNNGVTDGKDYNGHYISMPAGTSEHQTGLCMDITDIYYPIKNESIANTETFKYMVQHCHEYGFILRYPSGKEDITLVMYEPWHYRYLGSVDAATYIMQNNLTLEEFVALYK